MIQVPEPLASKMKEIFPSLNGTLEAVLSDESLTEKGRFPISELVQKVDADSGTKFIIFDGIITQRLVDAAAKANVAGIIGHRVGDIRNLPETLSVAPSETSGSSSSLGLDCIEFIPKQGICSLVVESPDDLWILRRLISPGDTVVTKSSRVSKREDEYSRPDRGERVKVTIALVVESVSLDSSIGRLRVRGRITEASDDSVSTAGSHSVSISPGFGLTLKKQEWSPFDTAILDSAKTGRRFLLVAMDRREAGIGASERGPPLHTLERGLGSLGEGGNPGGRPRAVLQEDCRNTPELLARGRLDSHRRPRSHEAGPRQPPGLGPRDGEELYRDRRIRPFRVGRRPQSHQV